jgi:predicted nucleotide-binding protein
MTDIANELSALTTESLTIAQRLNNDDFCSIVEEIESEVELAAKAWSGSWLGYHSRVYYLDLQPIPPGARFDSSSGLQERPFGSDTIGQWCEYTFDDIYDKLLNVVPELRHEAFVNAAREAKEKVDDLQQNLLSILDVLAASSNDTYFENLLQKAKETSPISARLFQKACQPTGQFMSSDYVAIQAGIQTPPHIALLAHIKSLESPFNVAAEISKIASQAQRHLLNKSQSPKQNRQGTKVFIGHGRAFVWRDLKDFIQDRLHLPWDEFNRVPVAGLTNIVRLSEMLDESAIAFLVMTAEDEQQDGAMHARMNVIHEVGLFQGRLGFTKAIVILESGCEEFSNIQGLGQIRFPKGNIKACFEEIRQVLEREGLIDIQ